MGWIEEQGSPIHAAWVMVGFETPDGCWIIGSTKIEPGGEFVTQIHVPNPIDFELDLGDLGTATLYPSVHFHRAIVKVPMKEYVFVKGRDYRDALRAWHEMVEDAPFQGVEPMAEETGDGETSPVPKGRNLS